MSNNNGAISGVYSGLKPIKTRKVWVIEIEVPEENIKHVTDIMGFPNQSDSQWVGVTLLRNEVDKKPPVVAESVEQEKSEGEKLRIRACCLCKEKEFQLYSTRINPTGVYAAEDHEWLARDYICTRCNIKSRSELTTNVAAQEKFKQLLEDFDKWKAGKRYSDNLERE